MCVCWGGGGLIYLIHSSDSLHSLLVPWDTAKPGLWALNWTNNCLLITVSKTLFIILNTHFLKKPLVSHWPCLRKLFNKFPYTCRYSETMQALTCQSILMIIFETIACFNVSCHTNIVYAH